MLASLQKVKWHLLDRIEHTHLYLWLHTPSPLYEGLDPPMWARQAPLHTQHLSNQPDLSPPAAGWESTDATLRVITYILFYIAPLISVWNVHQSVPVEHRMYGGSENVQGVFSDCRSPSRLKVLNMDSCAHQAKHSQYHPQKTKLDAAFSL